jgi:hypothetical protein
MELNSLRSNSPSNSGLGFEGTIGAQPVGGASAVGGNAGAAADPTAAGGGPANRLLNNPLAKVGVEYGRSLLASQAATQLSAGLGGWLRGTRLRAYFRVSQATVLRKIAKMLVPFLHRDWARTPASDGSDEAESGGLLAASNVEEGRGLDGSSPPLTFASAKEDVNAPDLYVGLMAFFTFIVTMGFAQGSIGQSVDKAHTDAEQASKMFKADSFRMHSLHLPSALLARLFFVLCRFSPESLGLTATRSLVCLLFELGVVYGAFYLADAPHSPSVLDLLCLLMAQFVSLAIDVLLGVVMGSTVFWIMFLALALSTAVYTMRTLSGWLPATAAALGGVDPLASAVSTPRFRSMLGVSAALQLAFALFLVWPSLGAVHSSRGLSLGGLASLTRAETSHGGIAPVAEGPTPVVEVLRSSNNAVAPPPPASVDDIQDIPSVLPVSVPVPDEPVVAADRPSTTREETPSVQTAEEPAPSTAARPARSPAAAPVRRRMPLPSSSSRADAEEVPSTPPTKPRPADASDVAAAAPEFAGH